MSNYSNMYYFLKNGDLKHITMKLPTKKRKKKGKTPEKDKILPLMQQLSFFFKSL